MAAASPSSRRYRLSIDLNEKERQLLDDLTARAGQITNAELFRRSLVLYHTVATHQERHGAIIFRHADGTDERLLIL